MLEKLAAEAEPIEQDSPEELSPERQMRIYDEMIREGEELAEKRKSQLQLVAGVIETMLQGADRDWEARIKAVHRKIQDKIATTFLSEYQVTRL